MRALLLLAAIPWLWLGATPAAADGWRLGLDPTVFSDVSSAPATRVGGWFDASFEDSSQRPPVGGIDHVDLFADTRWQSFQFFAEGEYERQTALAGFGGDQHFDLEQGYLRWQPSDAFGVSVGRYNTPFGWWLPLHWSILMDTATPPLYVGDQVVPDHQVGAQLSGRLFPHAGARLGAELGWSLFGGYGDEALGAGRSKGPTVGGDLHLRLAERYLVGASVYRQRDKALENRSELDGVLYGEARLPGALTFRSEWVYSHRSPVEKLLRNTDSVYASLRWDPHRLVYLAYRFGYGDEDDERAVHEDSLVGDTYRRTVQTVTLGILPHRDVRVKLEYDHNDLTSDRRPDFDYWTVSVGYLF